MSDTVKLPVIRMDSDDPRDKATCRQLAAERAKCDEIKQKDFAKCLAGRLEGHKTRLASVSNVLDFLSLHVDETGLDDLLALLAHELSDLYDDADNIQDDFAKLAAPILYGKEREE